MNNLVIMPIVIPVIIGLILIIFRNQIRFHRIFSVLSMLAVLAISVVLTIQIKDGGIQTLQLGSWEAPFGISLVADMFAIILIITSSIVAIACLIYAFTTIGYEREYFYFYPLFLFLMAGVNGSFLTGDIFNLFVCFEVMLVASYVLITLGGKKIQLRESFKYILINMLSSFLFLIAIAYLYRIVGTLNMAHLSVRVAETGQSGLLTVVSLLFLIVFGLKAGLFLFFWLPESYSAPPTAIAAVFAALLTKVGIYSIIRVFSLIFYHQPETTHMFIGILAAFTMILGGIGAIAYWDIKKILTYNVLVGVGFILAGFASFTEAGLTGSVYYLIHDIIVKALIFLIGGTIIFITGTTKVKEVSGLIRLYPQLGWMYFLTALAISGIPPLSGFIGKIFITEGTFSAQYFWLGGIGLFTSLMVLYSVMKIFLHVFWGYTDIETDLKLGKNMYVSIGLLTALVIFIGLGGELLSDYVNMAVEGLMNPQIYIDGVLSEK